MAETPTFDVAALLAKIRAGGKDYEAYVAEAYARVFADDLGRFVLLHHLQACGVGRRVGFDRTGAQLRYGAGMHDAAVQLANDAGYDEAALAAQLLTNDLPEEPSDARRTTNDAEFVPEPGDEY